MNVQASTHSTADDSVISGPMRLKSYYAVATYSDSKSKFSFSEGAVIQVMQKDASGKTPCWSHRLWSIKSIFHIFHACGLVSYNFNLAVLHCTARLKL